MDEASGDPELRPPPPWSEAAWWGSDSAITAEPPLRRFAGWVGALGVYGPEYWGGWRPSRIWSYNSVTGDVNHVRRSARGRATGVGSGDAWGDQVHAAHVAICEGLERYAALVHSVDQFTRARASDLGSGALDLNEIASFSEKEIAEFNGFIDRPDRELEIRWTKGFDLLGGAEVMVPAVMTYAIAERWSAERFWLPFSTGTAIHETPEKALLGALCEIVERDACAITWLQQLSIPPLSDDCLTEEAREVVDWFNRRGVQTFLFDATTDLGIPVVWCTQFSPYGEHTAQTTATACSLDQRDATLKAILECSRFIPAIEETRPPEDFKDFDSINSAAAYTGMRVSRAAFDFLVGGYGARKRAEPRVNGGLTTRGALRLVLERLSDKGYSVYGVDLTTREVSEAGLACVRAIVPQMQPLSVWPGAQYRGTTRLYEAPRSMGYRVLPESDLNPYPVPVT